MINIDKTVEGFYAKNAEQGYGSDYDRQHGPRLDAFVARFGLESLRGERLADIGGGLGFLGKRLHPSNNYWVFDGAKIVEKDRLCNGQWCHVDLDHDAFGEIDYFGMASETFKNEPINVFDKAFFLETLEHIGNPHHALVQIKALVKIGGEIYISIPPPEVWHNTPYPSLLWPKENFEVFLNQMALPIIEFWHYKPKDIGWPAWNFKCRNANWTESKMIFPKTEKKFCGITPLQATNL